MSANNIKILNINNKAKNAKEDSSSQALQRKIIKKVTFADDVQQQAGSFIQNANFLIKSLEKLEKKNTSSNENLNSAEIGYLFEKSKQTLNLSVLEANLYIDFKIYMNKMEKKDEEQTKEIVKVKLENIDLKTRNEFLTEKLEQSEVLNAKYENEINEWQFKYDQLNSLNDLQLSLDFKNKSYSPLNATLLKSLGAGLGGSSSGSEPGSGLSPDEFEVSQIKDDRRRNGNREYLIKWKNFSDNQNKWVKENMMTCPVILTSYLNMKKSKKQANGKKIVINNQTPTISNHIITRSRKIQFSKPNLQDSILLIS